MADLEIMVSGVAIVLGVLVMLWGLTALVGVLFRLATKGRGRAKGGDGGAEAGGGEASGAAVEAVAEDGAPPHHLVAIAAAVEAVLGQPHRILRVSAPPHRAPAWVREGRVEHNPFNGWTSRFGGGNRLADRTIT